MSTQNDLINYQNVIKEANSLINEQIKLWGGVVSSIQKVGKVTPSSFVKAQKEVNQALEKSIELETKLEAVEKKRQATVQQGLNTGSSLYRQREKELALVERKAQAEEKGAEREAKANDRRRLSDLQLQRQREQAFDKFERNLAKEQASLEKSANTYNKVNERVRVLTNTYNDLATRQALGQKLDTVQLTQLSKLQGQLISYDKILKQVDATVGNSRRNVGNYASGWSPLNNAVQQFSRELPNAGISFQTFVMSLTNNVGALQDAVTDLRLKNQQLMKDGLPTKSIIGQVAGAFLSWNTALFVGVGLITAYSKEIGEFFKQAFKGTSTMTALAESQKQYNDSLQEGSKNAQKEVQELKVLIGIAQNATLSTKQRTTAVKDLQELYPNYFKNLTTEQIMNNDLTSITKELTNALMARAIAVASINKMTENASKILDLEEENRLEQEKLKTYEKQAKVQAQRTVRDLTTTTRENDVYTTGRLQSATDKVLNTRRKILEADQEILRLNEVNTRLSEKAQQNQAKGMSADKEEKTKKPKKEKDKTKELLDEEYRLQVASINQMEDGISKELDLLQAWYEYQQKLHEDNANELLIAQLDYWTKLKKINDDNLKKQQKDKEEADKVFIDEQDELFKEDEENTKNYNESVAYWDEWRTNKALKEAEEREEIINRAYESVKGFASGVDFGTLGFSSLDFLNDLETISVAWESGLMSMQEKTAFIMKAIQGIMSDVFNAMEERQNAYFDTQFKNLETEKELAIKFAGENTAGKEAIERQYEEKKKALQIQQAKQQKTMAIAQATINIAQGITSALSMGLPGIILAALIGVLGAIQIAKIASTPLPQYATGRDGGVAEWAITQERGAEMITDKNGNIKTLGNNKGSQLTYLNKGDKVFTADETTQKLNEFLISSGISPIVNVSGGSGMSKEDMREVLNDTLAKQPKNSIIFDENGIKAFTSKENRRTILKNRNVRI